MHAETFTVPLSKLKPSPANVRRTGRDRDLAQLAASIKAHGLINPLRVEPERDAEGRETGAFLVHAGERRRLALCLLAKDKAIRKAEPIPCLPRGPSPAEEESLAENVNTAPMHPADQFEAFARLHRDQGLGAEDIAARFGLSAATVRQRLRLGAASPVLMELYRAGEMNLDQLTAFCLTDDPAAQERVWGELTSSRSPETIRRLLTRSQVPAHDRRALFVGAAAYQEAGGEIVRDLFTEDGGGWFADSVLLDRLVADRLATEAAAVRAEGWRWVAVQAEFPYAQAGACRRLWPEPVPHTDADMADAEMARVADLRAEIERLEAACVGGNMPDAIAARIAALEAEADALLHREAFAPDAIARAGAIVSLGHDGRLRVERGFVRPEDEAVPEPVPEPVSGPEDDPVSCPVSALPARMDLDDGPPWEVAEAADAAASGGTDGSGSGPEDPAEPDAAQPDAPEPAGLSDRLVEDLTAHRTAALQVCLAQDVTVALLAVTHALTLRAFYGVSTDPHSCLRIEPALATLPGIGECRANRELTELHQNWVKRLPRDAARLWDWLRARPQAVVLELLAFCAGRTVYAVKLPWTADGKRLAHADALAATLGLDMADWWQPTGDRYLSRIPKAGIRQAVREAVGPRDADALAGLRKPEMVAEAERLLAGARWLPPVLRTARPDADMAAA